MVHIAASHGFTTILDLYLSQYPSVERSYPSRYLSLTRRLQLRGRLGRFTRSYPIACRCYEGRARIRSGAKYASSRRPSQLTRLYPQILIDFAGADIIDAPDLYGNTPLHYASSWGKLPVRWQAFTSRTSTDLRCWQVVKLLVEMDCDVAAKNNEGFSAADYAFS